MGYDIAVIGAGPGGYSASIRAAELGARTVLIENSELGGICLNWGCIPTKTLLKSASVYRDIKKASVYGIEVGDAIPDFLRIMERKNKVISALRSGMAANLKKNGVEVIKGTASIRRPGEVSVDNNVFEAGAVIISVGSSPVRPDIPGIDDLSIIYSNQALSLDALPSTMVVIGGGSVGIEFAAIYNEFGTKVTVLELRESILPGYDHDISAEMKKVLTRAGIEVVTSAQVTSIRNGVVSFTVNGEKTGRTGEKVLISAGRKPNTYGLISEELGLETENGFIKTDSRMRTNVKGIYAVGDVNGKYMLAHTASAEGVTAAENALGHDSEIQYGAIPRCVYTYPEAASVGMTEQEARSSGLDVICSRQAVRANGKALSDGSTEGFAKLITDRTAGRLLGLHMVAPDAAEMITEGTLAIRYGLKTRELVGVIHPHPSVSEIIAEAGAGI